MGAGKRLLRVLGGEAVWPPPVWLMRQAGRYLPEYQMVRARAGDFIALCTTPGLATEVTLQPVRRFGLDAAILFSDILILPWALGYGLAFREGEGPVLPKLGGTADVAALDPAGLPARIAPVLETVRRVRAALGEGAEDAALIGFAGGPFTVACYMVDGRGEKDFPATRHLAYADPVLFAGLIEVLAEATIVYLSAQIAAGAETVMLFDSWAGLLPPALFARHVIAPTQRIVKALAERHPGVPVIGFPRMAGLSVGRYAATTAVRAVGLDTTADLQVAAGLLPDGVVIQGNLDPLALLAGGAAMKEQTTAILQALRGRPHVFNLGHGILPDTPPEHVAQLVALVRHA